MRAQRIPFLLLVAVLVAAPLASAAGESGSAITSKNAVNLTGTVTTDLTATHAILYEPGSRFNFSASAGNLTLYRYRVTYPACSGPIDCLPQQGRGPYFEDKVYKLTAARVEVTRTSGATFAYLSTDPTHAVTQPLTGAGWSTVTTTGPSFIGYIGGNNSGPGYDAYWSSFPTYSRNVSTAEFGQMGGKGGSDMRITLGGWFQLTPFATTFRVEGVDPATGDRVTDTFQSSPRMTTAFPYIGPSPSGDDELEYYVLEFDNAASGNLTTDGKIAHYHPTFTLEAKGAEVRYTPAKADGTAGPLETRSGDLRIDVLRIEGKKGLITFALAPLGGAVDPAGTGSPLEDPAVVGTAAAMTLAATLAALAYWWPQFRYALTALALPMYTRIAKDDVLSHGTRDYIYDLIKEAPGIHAHEISSRANIGWGTAVYHLKLLESHRMVVGKRDGRYKRFFVNDGRLSSKKEAYGILRNETSSQVAQYILNNPGCNQKDLCAALGMQPSLANWHTGKLEEAHLVKKIKEGRMVRYFAGPAWSEMQLPGFAGAAMATPLAAGRTGGVAPHATPDLIGEEN